MALGLLVEARRLHGHGKLSRRCAQGLDLPPVGASLVGAVVADLEHAGRTPGCVAAERHEHADQVFVPSAVEDLAVGGHEADAEMIGIRVAELWNVGRDGSVRPALNLAVEQFDGRDWEQAKANLDARD